MRDRTLCSTNISTPSVESSDHLTPILNYIFAHCEGDDRPYLTIEILGIKLKGLLDSGASRSILGAPGWRLLTKLGLKTCRSSIVTCTVANNQSCNVIGTVMLPLKLENQICTISLLVVPELTHSLILGIDFWKAMSLVPDLRRNCWSFSSDIETFPTVNAVLAQESLSSEQKERLNSLAGKYFNQMGSNIGCTNLIEHRIVTDAEPIKQRAYRVSPAIQAKIDEEVQSMLENNIIEPSSSPWSSPVLMVPKKDGNYRFCVDYRKLNKVTRNDAYPIPFVSAILDRLRNAKYLSSLDVKSAYWHIPVAEDSRPLTAFSIPGRGLFQFKRLPFGLSNAPATWQRLIDRVLGPELEPHVFVYLDDVIIVTEDFETHLRVLEETMKRLTQAGLTLSQDKCYLCRPELKYLGFVVNELGLHVDPDKVKAILEIPSPKNITEVRRVIGTASWYRRFIPAFSTVIAPLTSLLRKNRRWNWDEECENSFNFLKSCLSSAPILSCPNFKLPFFVQTDASAYGLGAVLSQQDEDGEHVICYISRSLSRAEQKYSTTERECLAVIWACEKLRPYLEGYKFTVITDHYSLIWLNNLQNPSGRITRWVLRLQQFDFEVIHRKGRDHIVPDLLSRTVPEITIVSAIENNTTPIKDKWYIKMVELVEAQPLSYPQWRLENQKLYKYVKCSFPKIREEGDFWKLVVPKEQRHHIIEKCHNSTEACHAGIFKTYQRLKGQYYWPKMRSDVYQYVRKCEICLANKSDHRPPPGLMGKCPEPSRPWQIISIDLCGPLPRSAKGYSFILVISDYLTKFVILVPLRQAIASAIVKAMEEQVFLTYGTPQLLICDNGVQFKSKEFNKLCEDYKVTIRFTPYYSPQSNPVERVNQDVKTMLRSYVSDNHKKWDQYLAKVGCALRTAMHETTGVTPFFANFGREHILTGDQHTNRLTTETEEEITPSEREKEFKNIYKEIRRRLTLIHNRSKQRYDLRRRPVEFTAGTKVYRRNYVLSDASRNFNAKLAPRYVGPFIIKRKISPITYELMDEHQKSKGVWHVKDIKEHPPDTPE